MEGDLLLWPDDYYWFQSRSFFSLIFCSNLLDLDGQVADEQEQTRRVESVNLKWTLLFAALRIHLQETRPVTSSGAFEQLNLIGTER